MALIDVSSAPPRWRAELGFGRRWITGPNPRTRAESRSERAESRYQIATQGLAAGAVSSLVGGAIGTGLSMRSSIDYRLIPYLSQERAKKWMERTNARFEMWASSRNCDATRQLDFYGLQQLAFRSQLASGDVFAQLAVMPARRMWPWRLAVNLIEADLVSNDKDQPDIAGRLVDGIQMDEFGAPEAAWIANRHPGTPGAFPRKWTKLEFEGRSGRRNLLHIKRMDRPNEVRGKTLLAPVLGLIGDFGEYSKAEVAKAVTTAMMVMVTKMDPHAFQTLYAGENDDEGASAAAGAAADEYLRRASAWDGRIRSNQAMNLMPGEEASMFSSSASTAFDPFCRGVIQQIAIGLELPSDVLMRRFENNYTAARGALLEALRTFRRRQDDTIKGLCQPTYEEWLADDIAAGGTEAPGFFDDPFLRYAWSRAHWVGDAPGVLDPLKEAQAMVMLKAEGLKTGHQLSIELDGVPWETKHEDLVDEQAQRVAGKLTLPLELPPEPTAATGAVRPPRAPARTNPSTPEPDDD